MGINNCTPATRKIIREYLVSVGKAKLTNIDHYTQADHLRQQIKPKCHKGHVINSYGSGGPFQCDSGRSGAACLKQMNVNIHCFNQGRSGSDNMFGSNHCFFCLPCGFHSQ